MIFLLEDKSIESMLNVIVRITKDSYQLSETFSGWQPYIGVWEQAKKPMKSLVLGSARSHVWCFKRITVIRDAWQVMV